MQVTAKLLERDVNCGTVEFHNSDWRYNAYYSLNIRQHLMSKTGRKLVYNFDDSLLSYIQTNIEKKYFSDAISGELRRQGIAKSE